MICVWTKDDSQPPDEKASPRSIRFRAYLLESHELDEDATQLNPIKKQDLKSLSNIGP